MEHWQPLCCEIFNNALRDRRIARDLVPDVEKRRNIFCYHPGLDLFPQRLKLSGYKMASDCAEHVPCAQEDPALWIHGLKRSDLRLIAISHYHPGPD